MIKHVKCYDHQNSTIPSFDFFISQFRWPGGKNSSLVTDRFGKPMNDS